MGMFKTPAPAKAVAKKAVAKKAAAPVTKAAARTRQRAEDDDADDGDGVITSGFGAAKKMAADYSGFTNRLSMVEETIVIRFGDDNGPYANVATHWFNKRKGRMSFMCLGSDRCPVCATGDRPRVTYCYNIIKLTDGAPQVWSGEWGIKVHRKIEKIYQDPKKRPLTKFYYELERTGLKQDDTDYNFKIVRRVSDIEEEHPDLMIPTEEQIAKLKLYTTADAKKAMPSLKEMQELAAELTGEDDDVEEED